MTPPDRIANLERRLDRIEQALGLAAAAPAPEPSPPTPPAILPPVVELTEEYEPAAVDPLPSLPSPAAVRHGTLEETIGLKWAGWVGAIVFVIGAGFLISWLYAGGYFAALPPAVRVAAMAVVGFALIAAGEVVYRRLDPRAAAGLFGAGVAVLLLVGYAGHGFYGLYGQGTAYVAMAAATVVGAAAAGRTGMVSVGVLSILGGAVAPALLHEGAPRPVGFFVYLAMLQAVALVMAFRGGHWKWWSLRWTSLAVTAWWVTATIGLPAFLQSPATPVFYLLFAAGFEGEVLAAAVRKSSGQTGVVFNIVVTGLLTAALLGFSTDAGTGVRVSWVLGLAVASAVLAAAYLRSSSLRTHAIGYGLQAAGLIAVVGPVALSGQWVAVAWLGWAVTLAVAGRWFDTPATRILPSIVWAAAVLDLLLWSVDLVGDSSSYTVLSIGSTTVPVGAVIGLILAFGGLLIAVLAASMRWWCAAVASAALSVWIVSAVEGFSPWVSTISIAIFAWMQAAVGTVARRRWLIGLTITTLAIAVGKWAGVDMGDRLAQAVPGGAILGFPSHSAWESLALASSVAGMFLWRRRDVEDYFLPVEPAVIVLTVLAVVTSILTLGCSFEAALWVLRNVHGTRGGLPSGQWSQLLWTGTWSLGLICFAAATQRLAGPMPRVSKVCGWMAVGLAVKFVLLDTAWYRFLGRPGPGPLLINPRFAVAAVLVTGAALVEWRESRRGATGATPAGNTALVLLMLIIVWAGTLEIDQATVGRTADAAHVATSVFWAVSAVLAVVIGFVYRRSAARYFGLGLLAVTLTKVVVVDLSHVATGFRILSFMGLGGLLLLTSVVYGKVSPSRRGGERTEPPKGREDERRTLNVER